MGGEDPGMHADIVLQPAKAIKLAFHGVEWEQGSD